MVGGLGVLFSEEEEEYPSQPSVPNPYAASSSSDEELEDDLDRVAEVRRSLRQPVSARAKKGWIAHQSVFPPSSSSSASLSDKETEDETDDEAVPSTSLHEPLLGHDDEERLAVKIPARLQVYHGRFGHWEREGLRKHKGGQASVADVGLTADATFLALWLTSLLGVVIGLFFVWGSTDVRPCRMESADISPLPKRPYQGPLWYRCSPFYSSSFFRLSLCHLCSSSCFDEQCDQSYWPRQ